MTFVQTLAIVSVVVSGTYGSGIGPGITVHISVVPGMAGGGSTYSLSPGGVAGGVQTAPGVCFDRFTGHHSDGDEWISGMTWKMTCNNGTIQIKACIAFINNQTVEIPINETKTVDGFWHKCQQNGTQVRCTQEPSCHVNGKQLHVNETFRQTNFKYSCQTWGYNIVGCYFDEAGTEYELAVGETLVKGTLKHFCEAVQGFPGRVRYRMEAIACNVNGTIYSEGDTWVDNRFTFQCKEHGSFRIINCVTEEGTEIPVGQTIVLSNIVHQCYRFFNTVQYRTQNCLPGQPGYVAPQTTNTVN